MKQQPVELSHRAVDALGLSPQVSRALKDIQAEVAEEYRESFVEMLQAIQRQASQLDRIQATLQVLVEHLAPTLKDTVPTAFRIAAASEAPDLASTLVVADPIGMGYSLTQTDIARALGLPPPYVSTLIRAFKLDDDEECAVVVRRGKKSKLVNYHPAVIARFRELVREPPEQLSGQASSHLRLVRERLGV